MTSKMPHDFQYRRYPIEEFGLSPDDCERIFHVMNGTLPDMQFPLSPSWLETELLAAAQESAADQAEFGWDTSIPRNDSPAMPAVLSELALKVSRLASWQQDALAFYAFGFWSGISAAERERDKRAVRGDAAPQG